MTIDPVELDEDPGLEDEEPIDLNGEEVATSPVSTRRRARVVIAGRPNVGKSTLVNRFVGRRVAIVEEHPGVTRDRFELEAEWRGCHFTIVDTGGMLERGDVLDKKVTAQALRATEDADLVLFVLDAMSGITADDDAVAQLLRRVSDKVLPVANKVDSANQEADAWALASYGFGVPFLVSALHGRSIGDLLDVVVDRLGLEPDPIEITNDDDDDDVLAEEPEREVVASVALVGRPNVGKSTLFNRLVGDERVIVHDMPGTTRDAIDTIVETEEGAIRFIDTAGLRRRSRVGTGSEYYSLVRSLAAIDRADISVLLIDATEGITHQEQVLAERVDIAGSPILIALNKWDLADTERRLAIADELEDRLGFLAYAPVLRISAKSGLGVHRLLPALRVTIDAYHRRIPTGRLNDVIKQIQAEHAAPGARILYAVQGAIDPPTMTLFVTRRLHESYLRYLEHQLRERFEFGPTPLKLRVRLRGS
ncbi:MAG TPA: ribosome biogenesis GTPase Der [Acidimicrobiales bacterium]